MRSTRPVLSHTASESRELLQAEEDQNGSDTVLDMADGEQPDRVQGEAVCPGRNRSGACTRGTASADSEAPAAALSAVLTRCQCR